LKLPQKIEVQKKKIDKKGSGYRVIFICLISLTSLLWRAKRACIPVPRKWKIKKFHDDSSSENEIRNYHYF
jgi:hypothetical protein